MVAVARIDCPYEHRPGGEAGAHHWQVEPRQVAPRWNVARRSGGRGSARHVRTARLDAGVGSFPVVALLALGRDHADRVEELGDLRVGHLVALEPEVAHVDAMQRRLVGRAVVAAHPERAGLDQHDAVGARGRAWRRRAAKRDGDEGGDQMAGHTRHCIDSRPARGVLQRQPRGSRRPRGVAARADRRRARRQRARRRYLRARVPAARPAVSLDEPRSGVEGDGRPIGQELFKKMEAKGVKGLCFGGGWGFRNMLSNKRPINTPDDMKGQTIRVQESPIYVAMMKQLGANPVPMPWGEVYLAMKQGTVDGMEIPVVTMFSDKFFEVTKYYSLTKHTYPPISWFMNLKRYQSLPADLRQVVDEAGKAACALDRKSEVDKEKGELELIRKAGVQVNEVKDLKPFQDRMGPAYDVVTTKVGKEWMDRVTAAVKAAQ